MSSDNLRLALLISADGATKTVAELLAIQAASKKIADEAPGIARLAGAFNLSGEAAKKLAKDLNRTPDEILQIADALKSMQRAGVSSEQQLLSLAAKFELTGEQAETLQTALKGGFAGQTKEVSALGGGIAELAFKFNNVIGAIQGLAAAARPAYDYLIGANENLNQQLLSSQTNLANSVKLSTGGVEITDPTEKIKASRPALEAALKQIEKDTQSLVGVTSQGVNELFQITLSNAGAINKQSKEFPDAISAATQLTKGWAAGLQVVGVPLNQARQEITSILRGQIDQNSILAHTLNINADQVREWKSQGILVDKLNEKLNTFVQGNKIAANSIGGVGSNIQDIFEILGREVGKPLLQPLIDSLNVVYEYLNKNKDAIIAYFQQMLNSAIQVGGQIGTALAPLGESLVKAAESLGPAFLQAFTGLAQVIGGVAAALGPIAALLGKVIEFVAALGATDLGKFAIEIGTATAALAVLGTTMNGLVVGIFPKFFAALGSSAIGTFGAETTGLAATALPKLTAAFANAGPAVTAFAGQAISVASTAVAALAQGGIPALVAAFPALTAGLTAATTAALPLAAALAPLAGAVALTFIVKGTQDMKVAQEELDALSGGTAALSEESIKYATKLKALQAIETNGGKLTAEQIAQRQQYLALSGQTAKAIEEQIASLKAAKPATEEQTNAIKAQIEELEARKKLLAGSGLEIEGIRAKELGTSYEQLVKKAKDAQQKLAEGTGTNDELTKAAKDYAETIKQQVELGQISAEQGAQQLEAIANNKQLEVSVQQAAAKDITELKKKELDQQKADLSAQIEAAETAAKSGKLAPIAAAQEVTRLKKAQLDIQLADVQQAIAREQQAIEEGRGSKSNLTNLQNQQKKLQADQQKESVEGEQRVQEARLKEVDNANQKAVGLAKLAETQKIAAIDQLEASGAISKEEAEQRKLTATRTRIDAELQAEQAKLKALNAEGKQANPELERQRQQKIVESETKIAQFRQQQTQNQEAQQKAAIARIEAETTKANAKIKAAETDRQIEIQKLINNGTISQAEAEQQKTKATQQRIDAELSLERDKLAKLKALPNANSADGQKAILAQQQKIADLTLQQLQTQAKLEEELRQAVITRLQQQQALQKVVTDAAILGIEQQVNAIDRQKVAQDAITKSLERQSKLLQSNSSLAKAQSDAITAQSNGELSAADKALKLRQELDKEKDPIKRQGIEQALAQLGVSSATDEIALLNQKQTIENQIAEQKRIAITAEQARARAALDLEIKKEESAARQGLLAAKRAELEAKIAQSKAQQQLSDANSQLAVAQQEKDPEKKKVAVAQATQAIAQAQQQNTLANQQVGDAATQRKDAEQGVEDQKQISEQSRQILAVQQQSETATLNQGENLRQVDQILESANVRAEAFNQSMQQAAAATQEISNATGASPAALPARRLGGPVTPGQPFLGAEEGAEAVRYGDGSYGLLPVPGVYEVPRSGMVLTARQTAALMGGKASGVSVPRGVGVMGRGGDGTLIDEVRALRADLATAGSTTHNQFQIVADQDPYRRMAEIAATVNRSRWK